MQPAGMYAIHIIVKGGRTMLLGVVDTPPTVSWRKFARAR
jgi:hypothetical protein